MKKGVSPTISWILLVGLAIMLAGIVIVWTRGLAETSSDIVVSNVESDIRCSDISVNSYEDIGPTCQRVVLQNRGLFSIHGVKIRTLGAVDDITLLIPLKPGDETAIDLNILNTLPDNKIGLIPITEIDQDFLACMEKEITISCS